jgi:homoserine O-acetyltransferase
MKVPSANHSTGQTVEDGVQRLSSLHLFSTMTMPAKLRSTIAIALFAAFAPPMVDAQTFPGRDYVIHNFKFESGETLPELRMHYVTLGQPRKDAGGIVRNAVIINHGTTGSGSTFIGHTWGDQSYGPGQILDTSKFYIVIPDGIGHGASSKPSDGLRTQFPKYTYNDMVNAEHRLLVDGLGVNHLRIAMGTSMGCMHAWVWGEMFPSFVDGLIPLACAPTQIAGRNRMIRTMIMDLIRDDPGYQGGNYTTQPASLRGAMGMLFLMTSAPKVQQSQAPTRDKADSVIHRYLDTNVKTHDANDVLYAFNSSRNYDPSPKLETITASVLAINSADDFVNPPELGLMEKLMPRVKHGRYVLLPITDQTRGHGTHSLPAIWKGYVAEWMKTLPQQ